MEEKINQAIKGALESAPKRKFVESLDIAFTIRDVDLKNPNNRIKEEIRLPSGRGRELKIAMFASGVPHMGLIGRYLGVVLGPRGKMPRPVPPTLDPAIIAAGLQSTVVVKSGDKMTFQISFGTATQSEEELYANAMEVYNRVISKLERGIGNIRSLYIKTTMGPSQMVEVIN